jgi:two-component system NarL family response regulator
MITPQVASLHELRPELTSTNTLDDLLRYCVAAIAQITGSESAGILLFAGDQDQSPLIVATSPFNQLYQVPVGLDRSHIIPAIISCRQPSLPDGSQIEPGSVADAAQPVLAVPLLYNDESIGILEIENSNGEKHFGEAHVEMLRVFSEQAAIAIQNTRMLHSLDRRNRLLEENVQKYQQKIEQQKQVLSKLDEQDRLGSDMCEGLGQLLELTKAQTLAAQTLISNGLGPAANANLERVLQFTQESQTQIRQFLSRSGSPAPSETSLLGSLDGYISEYCAGTGIQTTVSLPENETLPAFAPAVEKSILHIIHEALTNIRKHAQARKVEIIFSMHESNMQVIIADDGIGFDAKQIKNHFGLNKMRARAEFNGGRLEIRSIPGFGTKIIAYIPSVTPFESASIEISSKNIQGMRILLVDDSAIFVEGLSNLLSARGLLVIGVARDGFEAQEKARQLRPDIIVMDVMMPRCNGLDATRAIHAEFPEIKILMLTSSERDEHLYASIKNGASGFLLKGMDANEFCAQLANLARGETLISPDMAARMMLEFSPPKHPGEPGPVTDKELTDHQWRVLDLVAAGMTYKEVGAALHLSEKTIKYHMAQILERLHLKNRTQAVAFARRFVHEPGEPV